MLPARSLHLLKLLLSVLAPILLLSQQIYVSKNLIFSSQIVQREVNRIQCNREIALIENPLILSLLLYIFYKIHKHIYIYKIILSLPLLQVQPSISFSQEGHAATIYCYCVWSRAVTFRMIFSGQ